MSCITQLYRPSSTCWEAGPNIKQAKTKDERPGTRHSEKTHTARIINTIDRVARADGESIPVMLEALESKNVQHADGGLYLLPFAADVSVDRGHQPVEQLPVESFGKRVSSIVRLPQNVTSEHAQITVDNNTC